MTNFIVTAALLGMLVAQPSVAENYSFGAEENMLLGIRVAQPAATRDGLTPPKDIPSYYRAECGNCHELYPPNLLSDGGMFSDTSGWKEIMDDLHDHFGDNAELDETVRLRIRRYLLDNAASSERRFGSRTDQARLTTTLWFRRTHGRVKMHFNNPRVGSPAKCSACHPHAESWRYIREDVVLPIMQRRQEQPRDTNERQ
jgi:hypothetical protein